MHVLRGRYNFLGITINHLITAAKYRPALSYLQGHGSSIWNIWWMHESRITLSTQWMGHRHICSVIKIHQRWVRISHVDYTTVWRSLIWRWRIATLLGRSRQWSRWPITLWSRQDVTDVWSNRDIYELRNDGCGRRIGRRGWWFFF